METIIMGAILFFTGMAYSSDSVRHESKGRSYELKEELKNRYKAKGELLDSYSGETLEVDNRRLIQITSSISGNLTKQANQLLKMSSRSKEPVYILLNSPGGLVMAGTMFMDAMEMVKSRGVTLKCVSATYAASMAAVIMAYCNERYALKSTKILFHPIRMNGVRGAITAPRAATMAQSMDKTDAMFMEYIVRTSGIDAATFTAGYYTERWWSGYELSQATKSGWLKIVTDVQGIDNLLFNTRN